MFVTRKNLSVMLVVPPGLLIIPEQQYRKCIYHPLQQNTNRCHSPLAKIKKKIAVSTQKKKENETNYAEDKKDCEAMGSVFMVLTNGRSTWFPC